MLSSQEGGCIPGDLCPLWLAAPQSVVTGEEELGPKWAPFCEQTAELSPRDGSRLTGWVGVCNTLKR